MNSRPGIPELEAIKPSESNKAYVFDWSAELAGETIDPLSSSWLVQGDLAIVTAQQTETTTTVLLMPGKVGGRNLIKNTITTNPGGQRLTKSAAIRTVEYS